MWRIKWGCRPRFTTSIRQDCRAAYQPGGWKPPRLCGALSDPAQRCRKNSFVTYGNGEKRQTERDKEQCWSTKTICGENQPWQHYCFSVEWRYPGSCVTLLHSITAHTFLLNPITADQCCLFHSSSEMICLKVIFSLQTGGPKPAQLLFKDFTLGVQDGR